MSDDTQSEQWAFDKRISLGNLITTLSMVAVLIVWSVRLEGRIELVSSLAEINSARISKNEERIADAQREIIRRLERMEDKGDARAAREVRDAHDKQ